MKYETSRQVSRAEARKRQALIEALEYQDELAKRLCIDRFSHFVRAAWHVIEPNTPYVEGWHIDAICDHLEAVADFIIPKLIINMPPRHMKSILCSVMFPAWVWLKYPERRFIYCSYAESLAVRDSLKTRVVIESDFYQSLLDMLEGLPSDPEKPWQGKPKWSLKDDNNQKKFFENTHTGARMAVGVGGGLMGQGGDYLFVDDPLNALEVTSEAALEEVQVWHDTAFATRYNNPKRHAKVIIMQRLHENDLVGHLLADKKNRYDTLILPARLDPDSELKSKTTLGWQDPRTVKGELLWPDRFDEQALNDLEADLNRFNDSAEAQLQQDPKPKKGGLFPRENWQSFETWPSTVLDIVQFWDCAQKPGISNDYSVCATWVKSNNGFYLVDLWRDKVDAPGLQAMAESLYLKYRPSQVVIEDKSAGSSLIQYLLSETSLPVLPYNPGRTDKQVRATFATGTVKAKKCFLPFNAKWKKDFVKEHERFPKSKNDDQVDTTSMMVEYFQKRQGDGPRVRTT